MTLFKKEEITMEKTSKTLAVCGAGAITCGIIAITVGVTIGVLSIVSGGKLLAARKELKKH